MDDRELRVPFVGLDGSPLRGEDYLRIQDLVRESDARTNEDIDALIHEELVKIQNREPVTA